MEDGGCYGEYANYDDSVFSQSSSKAPRRKLQPNWSFLGVLHKSECSPGDVEIWLAETAAVEMANAGPIEEIPPGKKVIGGFRQGPAGGGPFVLMKPVWARPTLSSCNGLLSYCKALDLAAELWPPLSRYKGDNFIILYCDIPGPHTEHESAFELSDSQPAGAAECPANSLAKRVCKYQTYSTAPSCVT